MGFKNKIIWLNEYIKSNYEKNKEKIVAEKDAKISESNKNSPSEEENQQIEASPSTEVNGVDSTNSTTPSTKYEKIFKERVREEIEEYYKKVDKQSTNKKDNST